MTQSTNLEQWRSDKAMTQREKVDEDPYAGMFVSAFMLLVSIGAFTLARYLGAPETVCLILGLLILHTIVSFAVYALIAFARR